MAHPTKLVDEGEGIGIIIILPVSCKGRRIFVPTQRRSDLINVWCEVLNSPAYGSGSNATCFGEKNWSSIFEMTSLSIFSRCN